MAGHLDLKLVLEANSVRDVARWSQKLGRHGISTLGQLAALSEERLREWGIEDYGVCYRALRNAQELVASPQDLATMKQELLDSALYWACYHSNIVRAQEIMLLGANINYNYGNNGNTPLHTSAANGHTEVVAMLLQQPQINVNTCDKGGYTPLHTSAAKGYTEVVAMLLNLQKVDVNACDKGGYTPLHTCAANGYTEVVTKLLQEPRVNVNARDKDGWTPLHMSACYGQKEICKLLLNMKGIDMNSVHDRGYSPLHYASQRGHLDIVRMLVENGASLSLQDRCGKTPFDLAREKKRHDVVEYLQEQLLKQKTDKVSLKKEASSPHGDEDHSATTADEDTHTDPNALLDSSESSPPVDPSDAMDSMGLNVTMSIVNIGARGYPGTGKTSLLDLALGKDPAETRNSTSCFDLPSHCLVAKSKSQGVKWDLVTSEKMFDMVCDAMKNSLDNPQEQMEMTDRPIPSEASQPEFTQVDRTQETPHVPDDTHNSKAYTKTIEPDISFENLSWLLDLLKKTQESKGSGVIFDSHWMLITDSGGQPPFLDASALFLRNSSLQIFPLKLNEPLNYRPELSYFIDGKSACFTKFILNLSNQQIIETMAKSVSAIQPASTPSAIESAKGVKFAIVGTFEDQAYLCTETVEDKESTLDEVLKPYKDFQVRYGGKLILPVNATTADKEKRKMLTTKLRKLIVDASGVTIKVSVKLRWFVFLLRMLTRAEKQNRSILTLKECLELGKFLEMKESDIHKAIRFFHDINIIMHFNTPSLRNFVIVEATPLFDKVSLLLSASFVDEGFLANHCGLVLPSGAQALLQQHGRFCPEIFENFIKFEEPITKKFFLDVLVEVKAVVAVDESSEYIMPCALLYLPDDQCVPHPSTPWVIKFKIKRGVEEVFIPLPVGYLPALVVFLLTCFSSQFCMIRTDHQFRNLFALKYKRGGKVYIVERYLQLEIYFTFCEKLAGDCIVVRDSIQKAISLTEKRLHIAENTITKADSFLCPCDENAHHVCIYNNQTGIAECEVTAEVCILEAHHLRWIKSDATTAASSSQPSTTTQTTEKQSPHVVDGDSASSSSQMRSTTPQGAVKTSSQVKSPAQQPIERLSSVCGPSPYASSLSVPAVSSVDLSDIPDSILDIDSHLPLLMVALANVAYKWEHLGTQLGLKYGKLKEIKKTEIGVQMDCMREMLAAWLQGSGGECSKQALETALQRIGYS